MSLAEGIEKVLKNQEDQIKIEVLDSGMSMGRIIGSAKRIRKESKKVVEYTDSLSKDEEALFSNDYYLAGLILQKKSIDKMITAHIDKVVEGYRAEQRADEVEKAEIKEVA